MILGLVIAASVLVFDQLTKFVMLNYVLNERPGIELTSFFNLVYAWNTGVSFCGGCTGKRCVPCKSGSA